METMDSRSSEATGAHGQLQDSPVNSCLEHSSIRNGGGEGASDVSTSSSQEPVSEKRPSLSLEIPPRSFDDLYGKPPLSPGSARSSNSKARVAARPSFKSRVSTSPPVSLSSAQCSSSSSTKPQHNGEQQQVSPSGSSNVKLFSPAARRTSSLPVTPVADTVLAIQEQGHADETMSEKLLAAKFERSLSLPLKKTRSLKKNQGIMLVKPATPPAELTSKESPKTSSSPKGGEEHGQEIPAEQAVCRICMDELGEGGNTFQMECSCKGELALAHEDCALKWFGIKGNKTCDVCGKEVQNLPVMLLRLSNDGAVSRQQQSQLSRLEGIWQDIPVLIMISMLAYFCLLEQLLVGDLGSGALAIALPFACVLGLLASITASTLVSRKFIWGYAALQFALVILFAHVFYSVMPRMLQVHVEAVLSILLSAFAGFGIAMGVNGICLEYSSWQRRHQQERQHQQQGNGQQNGHEPIDIELGNPPNG